MGNKSNDLGRAYEYAWIIVLRDALKKNGPAEIVKNSSLCANQRAWETQSDIMRQTLKISARAAVNTVISLEPFLLEPRQDTVLLAPQADKTGIEGDVRDILIQRRGRQWEIGLSIKHNYETAKHSRLSPTIDFGQNWYGVACSEQYWSDVNPVFTRLQREKNMKRRWEELSDKNEGIYAPIIEAFVQELSRAYQIDSGISTRMMEYLIGIADYYKITSVDKKHMTLIRGFNIHDTLNQPHGLTAITVPYVELPTEIILIRKRPGKSNWAEVYMNNGWQISFRIHNADKFVENSLKFDIRLVGVPENMLSLQCDWDFCAR